MPLVRVQLVREAGAGLSDWCAAPAMSIEPCPLQHREALDRETETARRPPPFCTPRPTPGPSFALLFSLSTAPLHLSSDLGPRSYPSPARCAMNDINPFGGPRPGEEQAPSHPRPTPTTSDLRWAPKPASVWGRAEAGRRGGRTQALSRPRPASPKTRGHHCPRPQPPKNRCVLDSHADVCLRLQASGRRDTFNQTSQPRVETNARPLPEITGSSFSKAVLFSGNQCISTKINSFSVRMGRDTELI